jgi:glycosyltransferase involved in cell wall biosynthesis
LKIVVLNDLHPDYQPGAAGIALQYATLLSAENSVQFWCTQPEEDESYQKLGFPQKTATYKNSKMRRQLSSKPYRMFYEMFDFQIFLWLIKESLIFRPDIVWIHQIGNAVPKSVPLLFKILRIKTIQTHHDYSTFAFGKLYPSDFNLDSEEVLALSSPREFSEMKRTKLRFTRGNFFKRNFMRFRCLVLIQISNLNVKNVLLSPQQESINRNFGLKSIVLIPNAAQGCKCVNPLMKVGENRNILFAGRPVSKGLGLIANIVQNSESCKLFLAGKREILDYIPQSLSPSKYEYLGNLTQPELFQFMHKIDFVSVLSECFDVFPSILLEALSHDCKIIASPMVGNNYLINGDNVGYVLPSLEFSADLSIELIEHKYHVSRLDGDELNTPTIDAWASQIEKLLEELQFQ